MSGLIHGLGDTNYGGGPSGTGPVEYPSIDADDREFANQSVWYAGYRRGYLDGRTLGARSTWPEADPVSAAHLKMHCSAALKVIAKGITATQLPAASLEQEWLDGHKAGFEIGYRRGGGVFM